MQLIWEKRSNGHFKINCPLFIFSYWSPNQGNKVNFEPLSGLLGPSPSAISEKSHNIACDVTVRISKMQIVQIECQLSYFIIHEVFLFGTVFLWERFSFSQKFCFGTFFEWYKFYFGTFSKSMIGWKWYDSHTVWVTLFSPNHWLGKCAKIKFVSFKNVPKQNFWEIVNLSHKKTVPKRNTPCNSSTSKSNTLAVIQVRLNLNMIISKWSSLLMFKKRCQFKNDEMMRISNDTDNAYIKAFSFKSHYNATASTMPLRGDLSGPFIFCFLHDQVIIYWIIIYILNNHVVLDNKQPLSLVYCPQVRVRFRLQIDFLYLEFLLRSNQQLRLDDDNSMGQELFQRFLFYLQPAEIKQNLNLHSNEVPREYIFGLVQFRVANLASLHLQPF